jgi:hypothetical protein
MQVAVIFIFCVLHCLSSLLLGVDAADITGKITSMCTVSLYSIGRENVKYI